MADERDTAEDLRSELMNVVQIFALQLKQKHEANTWINEPVLPWAMTYLMTELWDRGFSSPEISDAFKSALEQLPNYSAGER